MKYSYTRIDGNTPFACLLLIFLLLSITSLAQDTSCALRNNAFAIGEKITYKVYYNWYAIWLNAGEVVFEVQPAVMDNKVCYHITGTGATHKSYDWFYKVRDKYETFVEVNSLQPLRFIRDVNEGGYSFHNDVTFKHDEGIAITSKKTLEIPNCLQDVLSAIYYSRCVDYSVLEKNDTIPIQLYLDNDMFDIYLRYLGKETIETRLGKFRCIKFKPLLIDGTIFKGGERMVVWVTDDENKIPIRVESPIIVGSIKADLSSYEGLLHDMAPTVE